jgi:hypothetical protein
MIGAIVKNNIIENLIVLNEAQIEELSLALQCEIVDARPYGLIKGDLRTEAGWTRNADGEQILLPLLEGESYDSYSIIAKKNAELTASANELNEYAQNAESIGARSAISEALDILTGFEEEEENYELSN